MRPALFLVAALALAACANEASPPAPLASPTDPYRAQSYGPSSGVDMQAPADEE